VPAERELKLRLGEVAAERVWRLLGARTAPAPRLLRSIYYDTPERELRAAGAALRLRYERRRSTQTLKADRAPQTGYAERMEWSAPAPRGRLNPRGIPRARVRAAIGLDPGALWERLRPVFETRFTRRSARVTLAGGARVEACLDEGHIEAGGRRERIRELELELLDGAPTALLSFARDLVASLGAALEPRSKAERGYRLSGKERDAPRKSIRPPIDRDTPAVTALETMLAGCLGQMQANLAGVQAGRDPEFLHQLRVATRRLRVVLRAYRRLPGAPSTKRLERQLRSVSGALGGARDWDVFTEALMRRVKRGAARRGLAALAARARRHRSEARRRAREVAGSSRLQSFLLAALHWQQAVPRGTEVPPRADAFARAVLGRALRRARRAARGRFADDPARRHALRICIKRLRYLAEYFAGCFGKAAARRYLEHLEALQDVLGELNDIDVAGRLLEEIGQDRCAAAAQSVRRSLERRERALLRRLLPAWRAFSETEPFW
jgi:inorganic triphosphatase YgiF